MAENANTKPRIRKLNSDDLYDLAEISMLSFESPWDQSAFHRRLSSKEFHGWGVDIDDAIRGFIVFSYFKKSMYIRHMAVHPEFRRQGIGSRLLETIPERIQQGKINSASVAVPDTHLGAQLFFHRNGFRAKSTLRRHFDAENGDAYFMELTPAPPVAPVLEAGDRISFS